MRRVWIGIALLGLVFALIVYGLTGSGRMASGPRVGEKVAALLAERVSLQALADGEARIGLLPAIRVASLLTDAIVGRLQPDNERAFARLSAPRRQAVTELDSLNAALGDALTRRGEGAQLAANKAADRANAELDRLAGLDKAPLILSYTPRFVPPRRMAGELAVAANASVGPPPTTAPHFGSMSAPMEPSVQTPTVPRYAPDFAAASEKEQSVEIEINGAHFEAGGPPPALSVGAWRGVGSMTSGRLHFAVPRSAFATDASRTRLVVATLAVRGRGRSATFQLPFIVLPDRPGAFALDQLVQKTSFEAQTLLSPEILARASTGESRTVRRCFDPPSGWRFDQEKRRIVVTERLGWQEDLSDPTLNSGSVEFVPQEKPGQICIAVTARPAIPEARTATIGRFEATLVRDKPVDEPVKSGIRALDWLEPIRVPIEPDMIEWKLYVRLFDEIDHQFDATPASTAFLRITRDADAQVIVLQADPLAEP